MVHVAIHHKVEDYARWKEIFDEQAKLRKESGSLGGILFRGEKDPNNVVALFQWDNVTKARIYFQSPFTRRCLTAHAGVIGEPEVFFEVAKTEA